MVSEEICDVIKFYHRRGYVYRLIHYILEKEHDCQISFQYLQKKVIPSLGLQRRGGLTIPFEALLEIVVSEINNGLEGPEQLRRTLAVKHDIFIPRHVSRELCRCLDERGVARRQQHRLRRRQYISKGPNYAWHLDGYDKLGPFGVFIHGCIDGYSRKIVWLKAGITNRRPEVIVNYFLEAIQDEGGYPWVLRGDCGTENTAVAVLVTDLHNRQTAFKYGRSTSNQRIERWWGYLRQARSDFWIHRFKLLRAKGLFEKENLLQKMCLQYCFMPFISAQLDEIRVLWNSHRIRSQKHGDIVSGVPELLHAHTELHGVNTYRTDISDQEVHRLKNNYENSYLDLDGDFLNVVSEVTAQLQLPLPEDLTSFDMCEELYIVISEIVSLL